MNTDGYTTNDMVLLKQFNEWMYGQYEHPCEENPILKEDGYHPQSRTSLEIWRMAVKLEKRADSPQAKAFYSKLGAKHRNRYIYQH